jgi:hypothetical protein
MSQPSATTGATKIAITKSSPFNKSSIIFSLRFSNFSSGNYIINMTNPITDRINSSVLIIPA